MENNNQTNAQYQRYVATRFKKTEEEKLALKKAKAEHKKLQQNETRIILR